MNHQNAVSTFRLQHRELCEKNRLVLEAAADERLERIMFTLEKISIRCRAYFAFIDGEYNIYFFMFHVSDKKVS